MAYDRLTPDADAKVEAEGAAAATGTMQSAFTEGGHGFASDIQVIELQKLAVGLISMSGATLKALLDNVQATRAQNAALIDNIVNTNAAHLNNLVNSASHRHSEIAADRQWNVNETDAFAAILADRVADRLTDL
jgi:hypothetical protein